MNDSINFKCEEILEELYKFSGDILSLGEKISDNRLEEFETVMGFQLPADFKYILKKHNSFSLSGTEVYGLDESFEESSLDRIYKFEHDAVWNPMFKELLPFSPDGYGNHYCLDLSKLKDNLCPVAFWQHDVNYTRLEDVELCNQNFIEWINEVMIEWTLEDTDYDGSKKL